MDWIALVGGLLTAGSVAWVAWAWEQMQQRRDWEANLRALGYRHTDMMRWVRLTYNPAPAPEHDPADTRALPPLPDDVTRALTEDE